MHLKNLVEKLHRHIPVRLFAGCHNQFHGTKDDADWNLNVRPFYDSKVLASKVENDTLVVVI